MDAIARMLKTPSRPLGAEWWYFNERVAVDYVYEGIFQNRVPHDTSVLGQECRTIKQTAYLRSTFSGWPYYDTVVLRKLFVYDHVDTVFIFNENFNRFTPLYIFNATVGDTLCLPIIPDIIENRSDTRIHPVTGDRSFCFIIDSIDIITYDKTYYVHFIITISERRVNGRLVYPFTIGSIIASVPLVPVLMQRKLVVWLVV